MAAIESLLTDFNGTEDTDMADGYDTDHTPEPPKPKALLRSSSSLMLDSYYADNPPALAAPQTQPLQEHQDFDSEMGFSDEEDAATVSSYREVTPGSYFADDEGGYDTETDDIQTLLSADVALNHNVDAEEEEVHYYETAPTPSAAFDDDGDYSILSGGDYSWGYGVELPEGFIAPTPRAVSTSAEPDSVHTYEPFKAQREYIANRLRAASSEPFDAPPSEPLDFDIATFTAPQQEEVNDATEISDIEFIDETAAEATTSSEATSAIEQYGDQYGDTDTDEMSAEATTSSESTPTAEQYGDEYEDTDSDEISAGATTSSEATSASEQYSDQDEDTDTDEMPAETTTSSEATPAAEQYGDQYEDTDNEDAYCLSTGGSTTSIGALAPQKSYDLLAGPIMGDATYADSDANSVIAAIFGNADYESDEDDKSPPVIATNFGNAGCKPDEDDESSEEEDNGPETPKDAHKIRPKLYFDDSTQNLQTRKAMYMIIDHHASGAGSSIDAEKEQFIRDNVPKSRTGHPSRIVRSTSSWMRFMDEVAPGPGEYRP